VPISICVQLICVTIRICRILWKARTNAIYIQRNCVFICWSSCAFIFQSCPFTTTTMISLPSSVCPKMFVIVIIASLCHRSTVYFHYWFVSPTVVQTYFRQLFLLGLLRQCTKRCQKKTGPVIGKQASDSDLLAAVYRRMGTAAFYKDWAHLQKKNTHFSNQQPHPI